VGQNNGPMFRLVPNVDDRVICKRCIDDDDEILSRCAELANFTVPIRVKFVLFVVEPVSPVAPTLSSFADFLAVGG
jgi:hypothetical protein